MVSQYCYLAITVEAERASGLTTTVEERHFSAALDAEQDGAKETA
jgi:hypothetical protein